MTTRKPVSDLQNIWFDSEQVDDTDLTQEQSFNNTIQSGLIDNHIGQGILAESLNQNIIFDSLLFSGLLDGTNIQAQSQPTDLNFGNQLEVGLSHSKASGKRAVKLAIIGLDFEGNLQYERFVFKSNEVIIGKKHFTQVLLLLFNDFIGPNSQSFNLGGRILIREVGSFSLSRDCLMVAQDVEPNIFFRDFFTTTSLTLNSLLTSSLPLYNIDNLNISTNSAGYKILLNNDVVSHVGQKFLAKTNNIQKINLLLSVQNTTPGDESNLDWGGTIVISIYSLQTTIDCPTDIAPNLQIDFSPSNSPIAQITENLSSLRDKGIILDSVPQPVDFVFSNTPVATGKFILPNTYYAVTIKRSGAASPCDILISNGTNQVEDARVTLFSGNLWTDIPEEDLWFQVWTDAAKVSSGQAYENGNGIIIPKTIVNELATTVDYSYGNLSFFGNDTFRGIVSSIIETSGTVQDQRTGSDVKSRKQFTPNVSLLGTIDISNLEKVGEPFSIGAISDKNKKILDTNTEITSYLHTYSMFEDQILIRVFNDPSDTQRYDLSVISLVSNLLNGDLVGAKILPNKNNLDEYYRIADAQLCSMIQGDVNGDGIVDEKDIASLTALLGGNLNVSPALDTIITPPVPGPVGSTTTFTNGYNTQLNSFATAYGLTYQLVNSVTNVVTLSGADGVLVANPNDITLAQFSSIGNNFSTIIGLSDYNLVIFSGDPKNNGGFKIVGLDVPTDVITIKKNILNPDIISQMMRADIDGDGTITDNDGYLLNNWVAKVPFQPGFVYTGPGTNPYSRIGTKFNVIKLRLEKFIDREDDYTSAGLDRNNQLHPIQDVFINDGYFFPSHDFLNNPVGIKIYKQLIWEEKLVAFNSKPRLVPSVFTSQTGFEDPRCELEGADCNIYPLPLEYDPGRVDLFTPNNLIIGNGGQIQRPDGYFYKVDFEVGTIVLEVPDGLFGAERTINLLDDFIADYNQNGVTRIGFPSMKFADCTFVQRDALAKDQLRFSVAVQSFSPNSIDSENVVEGKIGISIDYETGLLTLNFANLFQDPVLPTLNTKIQINVFLKKGGFNNQTLFVDSNKVQNMLKLISVFSGANVGGASSLVDLTTDVKEILPFIHGGTGLDSVGVNGTILMSGGAGLSYEFLYNLPGVTSFSNGIADTNKIPKTDGYGLLDPSFYYKNPVYIYGIAGKEINTTTTATAVGAFTFRFDSFIHQGLSSIKLEAILQTSNASNVATLSLFNVTTSTSVSLTGMTTVSTNAVLLRSQDIKSLLSSGITDYVYEIRLKLASAGDTATCKMARLVLTYNNPASAPPTSNSYNFQPNLS